MKRYDPDKHTWESKYIGKKDGKWSWLVRAIIVAVITGLIIIFTQ